MHIICISRGSYGHGKDFAEKLAKRLGYQCISREALTDQATAQGIPVGKVEMAVLKQRPLSENMIIEVDRFKAFVTAALCENALKGGIVYHGRTGHLVLPGVDHIMRVRIIADMEERISLAMNRLNLSRDKAKTYAAQVDEDRHRWVRQLYNVDLDDAALYDVTINSEKLSVSNSASVMMQMSKLPEFEPTPASRQKLRDLFLSARCRLAVGRDERTHSLKIQVKSERGNVSVTYLPRQAKIAEAIPSVLDEIDGISSLVCTVATTNILLIEENFDPEAESLGDLIVVAEKWNAAIELVRLDDNPPLAVVASKRPSITEYNGGILEDNEPSIYDNEEDPGTTASLNKLVQVGRAGGSHTVHGDVNSLVKSLEFTENVSLLVVGEVYLSKDESVRKRLTRDLISRLSDKVSAPVIATNDLKARYLFGPKQFLGMITYAILAVLIYFFLFTYQEQILGLMQPSEPHGKVVVAFSVAATIPIVAFIVGGFYHDVLKLIKLE